MDADDYKRQEALDDDAKEAEEAEEALADEAVDAYNEAVDAEPCPYQAYLSEVLRTLNETRPCESDRTAIIAEAARYLNERWAADEHLPGCD